MRLASNGNSSIAGNGGGPYKTLDGAVNVHSADVHKVIVNDYIHAHGVATTLTSAITEGDTDINVVDATGFTIGNHIHLGAPPVTIESIHPQITNIISNNVFLDGPLNNDYVNGSDIALALVNMAGATSSVGTLAAPISYKYFPQAGRIEDIERFLLTMTHSVAATDDKFGGIAALTNGVVFRFQMDNQITTFTNWKSNSDIKIDVFDVDYSDKAGPSLFGASARGSFSALDVAIKLNADNGDFMEILIQDDLQALASLRLKIQGHVEEI